MIRWAVCLLAMSVTSADATCRQALALGLDVSGSVDEREYKLQTDGLAAALTAPSVRDAFLAMPGAPVSLSIFEWSGEGEQRLLLNWTEVRQNATLDKIAGRLRATKRSDADLSTALGEAKAFGTSLLRQKPRCWRHTLDLSGDGKSNAGPRPQDVRPRGVTINALVIGEPETPGREGPGLGELTAYFRVFVIDGADAFIETAIGFDDFENAMIRKLVRELRVAIVGQTPAPPL